MDEAIHELLKIERKPTRVECIGFLQVLVSQQDSIHHLSKCVGILDWKPVSDESLSRIRDLRNRITSHSAWSDRNEDGGNSTSMVNWQDIRIGGFKAVVYRQPRDGQDSLYEDVDFVSFIDSNITALLPQIESILEAMSKTEIEFHNMLRQLDWVPFDNSSDGYLIEKLWSPWENDRVWQAKSHISIFSKRLDLLAKFIEENDIHELSKYQLKALIAGANKLNAYLINELPGENEKLEYDIMLEGWVKVWEEFNQSLSDFKQKIGLE